MVALLCDGNGTPIGVRIITFKPGTQTLSAVTDSTGVARVTATGGRPGSVPLAISFAGDSTYPATSTSPTILVGLEETLIRYPGNPFLGTAVPPQVPPVLLDPPEQAPFEKQFWLFRMGAFGRPDARTDG